MTTRSYPALAAALRQFIAQSGEDQSAVAFADFIAEAARVCEQHPEPNPLCHVQQAAPTLRAYDAQQAHPADEGMTWQAIRDVLLAGAVVAAILYPLFVWLLSLAPAPVPVR